MCPTPGTDGWNNNETGLFRIISTGTRCAALRRCAQLAGSCWFGRSGSVKDAQGRIVPPVELASFTVSFGKTPPTAAIQGTLGV